MRAYFRFSIGQMLLLTALAGLVIAMISTVYQQVSGTFGPQAVSFSPDDKAVAAQFTNGTVIGWDRNGKRLGSFDTGMNLIRFGQDSAFAMLDEQQVAVANDRAQLEIWEFGEEKPSRTFGRAGLPVGSSTALSRDGGTAATIRFGATPGIDVWDVETQQRRQLPGGTSNAQSLVLADDGSRIALIDGLGIATVVDSTTGEVMLTDASDGTLHRAFSADLSDWAAVDSGNGQSNGSPRVYVVSDENEFVADADTFPVALALSPDGKQLAMLSRTDSFFGVQLKIWDTTQDPSVPPRKLELNSGAQSWISMVLNQEATDLQFSSDGSKLLVASPGEVALLDVQSLQREKVYWRAGQDLGIWFFLPAFLLWAVLWGLARRRQFFAEQAVASGAGEAASTPDEAAPASPNNLPKPPTEMIVVWVLMGLGGAWAILWSTWIIFGTQYACWSLTPFPYIALFIGIVALSSAAGRRTDGLTRVGILQMVSMVSCDAINMILGIVAVILIHQVRPGRYLQVMNRQAEPSIPQEVPHAEVVDEAAPRGEANS